MTINGSVEILVHLKEFTNVDLFHQGMYAVEVKIQVEGKPYAQPSLVDAEPLVVSDDLQKILPAHVVHAESAFSSRAFVVRYSHETVDICDQARFVVDVPFDDPPPLLIEVSLLFAGLSPLADEESKEGEKEEPLAFKKSSSRLLQLRGQSALRGVFEVIPVVFDEWHFSSVTIYVSNSKLERIFANF